MQNAVAEEESKPQNDSCESCLRGEGVRAPGCPAWEKKKRAVVTGDCSAKDLTVNSGKLTGPSGPQFPHLSSGHGEGSMHWGGFVCRSESVDSCHAAGAGGVHPPSERKGEWKPISRWQGNCLHEFAASTTHEDHLG